MKNHKNYLIAVLTGLLVLSLFTQPAQSAPAKNYDAVKLIQYDRCLEFSKEGKGDSGLFYMRADLAMKELLASCAYLKP